MGSIRHKNEMQKEWLHLVLKVHSKLVQSIEWTKGRADSARWIDELPQFAELVCKMEASEISADEREVLVRAVISETTGLGPLDPLLEDPLVSDVLVNGCDEVFIERQGRLIRTPVCFLDDDHLLRIIQRIASRVGRRIDESSPMVDARLEDGSRVHAVVRPLAIQGPTLSIRRFGTKPLGIGELLDYGSMNDEMVDLLKVAVESKVGILISGGTGAGKTTLLNAISSFIPKSERLVTIEDAAELKLQHPHVVSLESRPKSAEGLGQVSIRELVRTSLRMRPDRILVGEVRGDEVIDMLQAMNTGHPGSMCTIHANSARDALSRLEVMAGMSGYELPLPVLRKYVASGIQLLVQVERLRGGRRCVTQISEVIGLRRGEYRLRPICGFKQDGVDSEGQAEGEFFETEYVPRFYRKARLGQVSSSMNRTRSLATDRHRTIFSGASSSDLTASRKPQIPRFSIGSVEIETLEVETEEIETEEIETEECELDSRDLEGDSLSVDPIKAVESQVVVLSSEEQPIVIGVSALETSPWMAMATPSPALFEVIEQRLEVQYPDAERNEVDDVLKSLQLEASDEAIESLNSLFGRPR